MALFISMMPHLYGQSIATDFPVAMAKEIKPITVDGNLNDWPKDLIKHQINKLFWGDEIKKEQDAKAYFKVAYNLRENSMYLAIIVEDDERISSAEKPFYEQDAYSMFIDEQHDKRGSGVAKYSFSKTVKHLGDNELGWDPKLDEYLNWSKVNYKVSNQGSTTIYEIKYTFNEPLYRGRAIGLGHVVVDIDTNEESLLDWVGRGGKNDTARPGRMGLIIFAKKESQVSKVIGRVQWKDTNIKIRPRGVKILSKTDPNFWAFAPVKDETGNFEMILPKGSYYLAPAKEIFLDDYVYHRADINHNKSFRVSSGKTANIGTYFLKEVKKPRFTYPGNILKDYSSSNIKKLNKVIQEYMAFYQIEGASLAILKEDQIVYRQHYGVENGYSKEPVTSKTLFEVASITKPFFAFAVMRLYERGLIDLDKPLYQYLPFERVQGEPYAKKLTARIILSHQTGLPNWPSREGYSFAFEPGTQFSYSGSAYQYLGRVLEKITGKPIDQILKEEVSEPLGIDHLYFKTDPYAKQHKAHGHYYGYPGFLDLPESPWIAGSLISNTESLAQFLVAIDQRKGLKSSTYETMLKEYIKVPEDYIENIWDHDEYMSLGFYLEHVDENTSAFGHTGNNGDFKSVFKYFKEEKVGYVLLVNGHTGKFLETYLEKFLRDPEKM